jgi:ppGpp synthetase/RelA/SpoT-type nucleotidyltranferase
LKGEDMAEKRAEVHILSPEFTSGGVFDSFEKFISHPDIQQFIEKYQHIAKLAKAACNTLECDFESLHDAYYKEHKSSLIVSFNTRVKEENSFLRKFYTLCAEQTPETGIFNKFFEQIFHSIYDICGARFSCAYLSDVIPTLHDFIRPYLSELGYQVDLQADPKLSDKNTLENGDKHGYRSYHFYIMVPTITDI